ncbi:S8 family serine peptidase [Sulfitobacter sediminilitoris]|uniref:S8 family serine peptidase n=1 Tax=Sulfitobacter sediminilitoris TaxID=2698830 RepID=UPI003616BFDF
MTQDIIRTLPQPDQGPSNAPGRYQVLVKLAPGDRAGIPEAVLEQFNGRFEKFALRASDILSEDGSAVLVLSFPDRVPEAAVLRMLEARPNVELAELDSQVQVSLASSDTLYTDGIMWGMYGPAGDGIGAADNTFGSRADVAWANAQVSADGRVGDMNTVVGVIDSGIDPLHPDLYLNIWINQNEIPTGLAVDGDGDGVITFRDLNQTDGTGAYVNTVSDINGNGYIDADDILRDSRWANGVDNDSNGYTDDLFGWDFYGNDNRPFEAYRDDPARFPDRNPSDSYHGTHVAGTIGASANGAGVVGVTWDVQMMPLRFIGPNGTGNTSDAVMALNYYASLGQAHGGLNFVGTNNSWGGSTPLTTLETSIQAAGNLGHLFVAAAGNDTQNNDTAGSYPANFEITSVFNGQLYDPVISVASIESDGALSSFSNYGATSVDLGAPGDA